jgi:hypothetical protein
MRSFEASPKERQAFPITQPDTRSARENRSVSRPRATSERVHLAMGVSAAYRSQGVFNPARATRQGMRVHLTKAIDLLRA